MAYTLEQVGALEEAIATGVLEVWYGDKRTTFRSLDDMVRTMNIMKTSLGLITPGGTRIVGSFDKGLHGGRNCEEGKSW